MTEIREYVAMEDGVRLAISRFVPEGDGPWPVILEALPYRKDDLTASYRLEYRRLVAEGRYVVVRTDVRGTGSSEGIATDEYPVQEQRDLTCVIAWCAAQPWSNGNVGMYGTSYSGFNSLQLAVEQPPALKAVCSIYGTDDRYTDDSHYMGGVLRALDLVDYISYMVALVALPPVPAVFGDGWREEWRRRVDGTEPWLLRWFEEQTDGPYWRHGSLRLDSRPGTVAGYERIRCATMIVAGWADGYRNNTFRTFATLECEKRLLVGPWSHMATATSLPGPQVDLVPELIDFFDRYLRDEERAPAAPPIAVFVRRATRPEPDLENLHGEWRYEDAWPPARATTRVLRPTGAAADLIPVRGDVGQAAWNSCAASLPWGQPTDQRADDGWSRCYEWPVTDEFEILGHTVLHARVTASVPVAYLSAKLSAVLPDGTSVLVTRGLLNLTHRNSSVNPEPLVPGEPVDVTLELEASSFVFEPGQLVRLALAGTDWPNAWPPPEPVTLQVERGSIELCLPELPPLASPSVPQFVPPDPSGWHGGDANADDAHSEPQPPTVWRFTEDVLDRRATTTVSHGSRYDAELESRVREQYDGEVSVSTVDPGAAAAWATTRFEIAWPEASVAAESRFRVRSDAHTYHLEVELDVDDGSEPFARRRWRRAVPRKLQ